MTTRLPTGTLTILFTDIEGSTLLLQRLGDGYRRVRYVMLETVRQYSRGKLGTTGAARAAEGVAGA